MKQIDKIVVLVLMLTYTMGLSAQIGINTEEPHSSATLDINSTTNDKGLLIPQMTTAQKLAITVPASGLIVYDTDYKCISQYKDTPSNPGTFAWTCLTLYNRHFFYMPSVNIPTSDGLGALLTGTQTINLYNTYKVGFNTPMVSNTNPIVPIPHFEKEQLNFYITHHDPCITVTGISDDGVLSYTVNRLPNYDAYINVVFTLK